MKLMRIGQYAFEWDHLCAAEFTEQSDRVVSLRLHIDFQDDLSKLATVEVAGDQRQALLARLRTHPDFHVNDGWAVHWSRVCRARLENSALHLVFWFGSTSIGRPRHLTIEGPAASAHFQLLGEAL